MWSEWARWIVGLIRNIFVFSFRQSNKILLFNPLLKSVMLNEIIYVILCCCTVHTVVHVFDWMEHVRLLKSMNTLSASKEHSIWHEIEITQKHTECKTFKILFCILDLIWTIRQFIWIRCYLSLEMVRVDERNVVKQKKQCDQK